MLMLVMEEPRGAKHLYNKINRAIHRGNLDSSRDVFFLTVKGKQV
jgi:hypothetical protein